MTITLTPTQFQQIKDRIVTARVVAHKEAKTTKLPFLRSRGCVLGTSNLSDQCIPFVAAEGHTWGGTKRELIASIQKAIDTPGATEFYLEGGYDGGERLDDFDGGNYEPWVSTWTVLIWTRAGGILP